MCTPSRPPCRGIARLWEAQSGQGSQAHWRALLCQICENFFCLHRAFQRESWGLEGPLWCPSALSFTTQRDAEDNAL